MHLTLSLWSASEGPIADSVDQDQTAQNLQSGLVSTPSDGEIVFLKKKKKKIQHN